jgi:DNA-binding beta-propeller fold protein YncE
VLLLPLAALLLLSRGGARRTAVAPAVPAPAPEVESEEPPAIRESAEAGLAPFGNLKEPRDAAFDGRGRLWVADFGNSRLRIFDARGGFLGGWGGKGDGPHGFRDLSAVAIRGEDVYVADTWNGRAERFGQDGARKASAPGFFGPRGIAVGGNGDVWVSDTGNHRVSHFDSALSALDVVGGPGNGPGQFSSPVGITVAGNGTVYVADTGNRRIVLLDPTGKFLTSWPVPGWDRAVEPHLELDDDGSLWATDPGSAEALLHFDGKGKLMDRRTSDDEGRRFSIPTGLALDRKTRALYTGSNVISKLRLAAGHGKRR